MLFMLQGLLHYHINNPNILLSEIFIKMKETKKRYSVFEDFTVGQWRNWGVARGRTCDPKYNVWVAKVLFCNPWKFHIYDVSLDSKKIK